MSGHLHNIAPNIVPNPLEQYYRVPGVHVKLPTRGLFMPPGTIEFSMTGDLSVKPMAAKDELHLKSPDMLMSGVALEKLIESCVPSIRAPRLVSTQDLDVILLAIRAATYGDVMKLDVTCPKCETISEIECNLPALLATMKQVEDNSVRINDEIVAYVRPYNIDNATRMAMASYDEARRLQNLENSELTSTERNKEIQKSMDKINKMNLEMLSDCIMKIVVPGAEVTDRMAIYAFICNVAKPWVEKIDKKLKEVNSIGIDKSLRVKCSKETCGHEWTTEVEFNPSTFFDAASSR